MDLIYITEDKPEMDGPNFTIPNSAGKIDIKNSKDILTKNVGFAGNVGISSLVTWGLVPFPLLTGAAILAPLLANALSSKDASEEISKENADFLLDFIKRHSFTIKNALERGFKFPPGHPRVGESYRLHPLAKHSTLSKQDLYIPEQNFDDLLFEERESELLSILVHLGAVEVEIVKYITNLTERARSVNIGAGVDLVGEARIEGSDGASNENNDKNLRIFTLRGKPWVYGNKIDRSDYAWLNFEPSWNALITAREIGDCTSATLEIKEVSRNDTNREIAMNLKAKIYSADGSLKLSDKDLKKTSYMVKVRFS